MCVQNTMKAIEVFLHFISVWVLLSRKIIGLAEVEEFVVGLHPPIRLIQYLVLLVLPSIPL